VTATGTWDTILTRLLPQADAAGVQDWAVTIDSTTARVHQHAATLQPEVAAMRSSRMGGALLADAGTRGRGNEP
jgi:hypothetical protein